MKEQYSNTCETAAFRVQFLFGRDKASLLHRNNVESKSQDFSKKYKCNLVSSFRVPSQIGQLPLQSYVFSRQKKQVKTRYVTTGNSTESIGIAIEAYQCSESQKNLNYVAPECVLSPARVAYCKLKEYFFASKKLKSFSNYQCSGPKRHDVVSIKTHSEEGLSQNPHFQEWSKFKEERQFQICRVIKYLAD